LEVIMPIPLSLDACYLSPDVTPEEVYSWQEAVTLQHNLLESGTGPGSDFLGWMDPHAMIPDDELDRIIQVSNELRDTSDVLVVIGIGGSWIQWLSV
jgi:glucose-6-phosphate isomerase